MGRGKVAAEKKELIPITYSFWDGSGHRKSLEIAKGATVGQFLRIARQHLAQEFSLLRHVASDELLLVKEDVILPPNVTFWELWRDGARGPRGSALFSFESSDTRMVGGLTEMHDVRHQLAPGASHAAKIVQKTWYESNKHVFPQPRWEAFDLSKHIPSNSAK